MKGYNTTTRGHHPFFNSTPQIACGNPAFYSPGEVLLLFLLPLRRRKFPPLIISECFNRESFSFVMPEIFYQASMFLLFLFVLLLVIIGMFPPIVWTPRRTIQEWPPPSVIPEIFYQTSTSFVIPEIFYRESKGFYWGRFSLPQNF